jgi:argininosuccinate lyase
MLGFDGLQVNSYGAIAAVDYVAESCGALATAMLSLGRFVQDLLLWSTVEFGYIRLSDAYVQISSIMPQKRNPVPFEHVRVLASRALFEAHSVIGSLHNTPFADMNDAEDDLQPLVYTSFDDAERAILLLAGALSEAEFNTTRMAQAANGNFLPVTELADTLVRVTGMSFHAAHTIVSKAVRDLNGKYDTDAMTAIVERELDGSGHLIAREQIRSALNAKNFVAVRKIPGGPAAEALEPEVARARERIAEDDRWLKKSAQKLADARQVMRQECDSLLRGMDGR